MSRCEWALLGAFILWIGTALIDALWPDKTK
jgi:hypothetical protein